MWSIDWRLYCFYEILKGISGLSVAVSLGEETEVLDKLNAAAAASSQRMNGCWYTRTQRKRTKRVLE